MTPAQALSSTRTHGLKQFSRFEVVADPAGAYVLVELTKGQWCDVDVDDWFNGLDRFKWCAMWNKYTRSYYAYGRIEGGKGKCVMMHRLILGIQGTKIRGDHSNHDTLCNRRFNLRKSSHAQNAMNRKGLPSNNTSGYMGVCWNKKYRKWQVEVKANNIRHNVGYFDDLIEAAKARDQKAIALHGEFACLNFQIEGCA